MENDPNARLQRFLFQIQAACHRQARRGPSRLVPAPSIRSDTANGLGGRDLKSLGPGEVAKTVIETLRGNLPRPGDFAPQQPCRNKALNAIWPSPMWAKTVTSWGALRVAMSALRSRWS